MIRLLDSWDLAQFERKEAPDDLSEGDLVNCKIEDQPGLRLARQITIRERARVPTLPRDATRTGIVATNETDLENFLRAYGQKPLQNILALLPPWSHAPAAYQVYDARFSGPVSLLDLSRRLDRAGYVFFAGAPTLVLGTDADVRGIWQLLTLRAGLETRIVAQPRFLTELTGVQVDDVPGERLTRDLDLILGPRWRESGFRVPKEFGSFRWAELRLNSPLTLLDYRASRDSTSQKRRSILLRAIRLPLHQLPWVDGPEYMVEWGAANSFARLKRIRSQISFDINLHAGDRHEQARMDWTSDLEWLDAGVRTGELQLS